MIYSLVKYKFYDSKLIKIVYYGAQVSGKNIRIQFKSLRILWLPSSTVLRTPRYPASCQQ